jgi:hypothetical protein
MKERATQIFLLIACALLAVNLLLTARPLPAAQGEEAGPAAAVLRAQTFELVNKQGLVVVQLHAGEDGGGNLRMRSADGSVRMKLAATADGGGLLLLDKDVEPAVQLGAGKTGTSLTLSEKGKERLIIRP